MHQPIHPDPKSMAMDRTAEKSGTIELQARRLDRWLLDMYCSGSDFKLIKNPCRLDAPPGLWWSLLSAAFWWPALNKHEALGTLSGHYRDWIWDLWILEDGCMMWLWMHREGKRLRRYQVGGWWLRRQLESTRWWIGKACWTAVKQCQLLASGKNEDEPSSLNIPADHCNWILKMSLVMWIYKSSSFEAIPCSEVGLDLHGELPVCGECGRRREEGRGK